MSTTSRCETQQASTAYSMDSTARLYLERAENELELARIIFTITENDDLKAVFHVSKTRTFYSAVITHSYYCIFYATKAYLFTKGIKTAAPEEHRKAYGSFKHLVTEGIVDRELLAHYETVLFQASELLSIFKTEKRKRGDFTYQRLSQANRAPAEQSTTHAAYFFKHLYALCA
jgi:uncharacterized protein (UPF0332 family)